MDIFYGLRISVGYERNIAFLSLLFKLIDLEEREKGWMILRGEEKMEVYEEMDNCLVDDMEKEDA